MGNIGIQTDSNEESSSSFDDDHIVLDDQHMMIIGLWELNIPTFYVACIAELSAPSTKTMDEIF